MFFCFSPSTIFPQNYATDLVNTFVGTGGHGHTFPGACVPNGLVQLSPDTRPDPVEWDGCGGYHYSDSLIYGFSHTHLSGTGVADLCDLLLMPVCTDHSFDPAEYASSFSHVNEKAHAGYYQVHLDDEDIDVELTATQRVGMHRYRFNRDHDARILLDLRHRDRLDKGEINVISSTEVVGERRSSSWATDQRFFYCIRFSAPMKRDIVASTLYDPHVCTFNFGKLSGPLTVKVGISAVSIEGARKNLEAEVPHWDFDQVKQEAEGEWNDKLSKIKVEGGTREQQRIFYTALYHCYIAPYIFNDVDGQYRGMDGDVHHADHNVYTVFSLWDTFRALHPLMTILEPDMTNDWIRTFLLHYQQGGKLPVWELWGNETDCMIGYHSVSVITDAYMKGIRGYDADLALEAMMNTASNDQDPCLCAYTNKGFIGSGDCAESVSKTLEFAYDDACIANMMALMGKEHLKGHRLLEYRSKAHKNLFDPNTGFFRARRNGGFVPGFDPYEVNFNFTEANAWQYSLFVPQDIPGMVDLFGGEREMEEHLDRSFSADQHTTGRDQADITGLIGQYAHGNEPSHHMAYLYTAAGRPEKTRQMVRRILNEQYQDTPDGLSGNEDCGQMSAWYVLSALGAYPVSPGINERYTLGHPLFDKASVSLPNGKEWVMDVDLLGEFIPNVPQDTTDQVSYVPTEILYSDIMNGASLRFDAEREPYRLYHVPQNIISPVPQEKPCDRLGAPVINAPARTFKNRMVVSILGCGKCTVVENGVETKCDPTTPVLLQADAMVTMAWSEVFAPVVAHFTKIDHDRSVQLHSEYANQYAAGSDKALIDGLRGGKDFRTGEWQGYQGQDVSFTIDLGQVQTLDSIGIGMLQDMRSWIWYPSEVEIAISKNQQRWRSITLNHNVDRKLEGGMTQDLWTGPMNSKARYITIIAKNGGPCPEWHLGAGGESWIFLDEVLIGTR